MLNRQTDRQTDRQTSRLAEFISASRGRAIDEEIPHKYLSLERDFMRVRDESRASDNDLVEIAAK